ncbi:MAG: 34-kDa subunit of RNA polymerase III (C) [Peltula sp. TS41687]|nr:MAG: 34-kDa subunit of RNA polymerase III (C) [Peltula sp. TS41687]
MAPSRSKDRQSIDELKDALYARCSSDNAGTEYTTEDLVGLGIVSNKEILLDCTSKLLEERLFKVSKQGADGFVFSVVKREDAARYKSLNPDEEMVFSHIEASGQEGIWTRSIKTRTNLHQSVVLKTLKSLEQKGFIKAISNVKFPTRKIYMLASLSPSEDVTGGPWFTDGELDAEFVRTLCDLTATFIHSRSFYRPPAPSNSKRRRTATTTTRGHTVEQPITATTTGTSTTLLPYPPTYTTYPTLREILAWLNTSGVTEVPLAEEHVRQLTDILYYDNRIERVNDGKAFRAVRDNPPAAAAAADDQEDLGLPGRGNAFTEAPCGRCPVFGLCEEGGPVSASTCVYFKEWLER